MEEKQEKSFMQSIYGKVVAAFFIGVVAIGLAGLVSKVGFREMLETVESLSAPNEKLRLVNSLFYRVTQLEQMQHVNALENSAETPKDFDPEIKEVLASVDSLRSFCQGSAVQLARLDSMTNLLKERQQLSESYFTLRNDNEQNNRLTSRINDLSALLANLQLKQNKKVVTTSKKYTTTTLVPPGKRKVAIEPAVNAEPEPQKTSFLGRLFGGNKKTKTAKTEKIKKGTQEVKEEVTVKVDTYLVSRKNNSLAEVETELREIEKEYHERNAALLSRELALVKASHKLNRQLLGILKTFEAEEISQSQGDHLKATSVVQSSVSRMNIITVIFSLGAALFAYLIVLDISRSHKYRKLLVQAKEEAEHLSQVKQRFLANMSHELRTPLQSILGFSEQVRHQEKPSREALEAIFYSSEHLLQIVNEVLDYSRIISGKFTFEEQPFDVEKLTKDLIATLQPQATKKQLKLSFNFTSEIGSYISGDPFRLRQVLYNLLGNAIKFTDKGEVSLTVNSSLQGDKGVFSFKVKDSGIGIPKADIDRIFNQFEQVTGVEMQKYGGTGLGLSIVKSLVESQEGSLSVSSELGEGSVFEIQLPYLLLEKPEETVAPEACAEPETAFSGEVLVVDDDPIILKLIGAILTRNKIKNTCLNSSLAAAEMELPKTLRVVFTDMQMPEMSGMELGEILRQKMPAGAKIFALTAQALPEEHEAIRAQGFDGILTKPFREQEILAVIQEAEAAELESDMQEVFSVSETEEVFSEPDFVPDLTLNRI